MIVSCPECDTSFNLPDKRVTDKGSKVRCSKCKHVFRVRRGSDGEPEIYYKNEGVADPPTQELGDIFDDMVDDIDAALGGQESSFAEALSEAAAEPDEDFDDVARRTMIGFPAQEAEDKRKPSKSAAADFDPFPLAGLAKKKEESGIDLFDGEDPEVPQPEPEADPFAGAFENEAAAAGAPADDVLQAQAGPRTLAQPDVAPAAAPAPAPAVTPAPAATAAPPAESEGGDELSDVFLGKGAQFGPADDLVDPNFGEDHYFDPEQGKVAPPPAAAAPPPQTARRPAPAQKAAPKPQAQAASPPVEDWDIEPHKMGGGGFQKFVNLMFIIVIVLLGCLGYVAFRSDGMLDFKRADAMLRIMMHDAEFEPRDEWKKEPPPAPKTEEPALVAKNVFANVINLTEGEILLVRGTVTNQSEASIDKPKVRVMVLDEREKILRDTTISVGQVAAAQDVAALPSPDEFGSLKLSDPVAVAPGQSAPFMAFIVDVPASVKENKEVSYRVEIAGE